MVAFVVHGPRRLKYESRKGGRTLVFDSGFWTENDDIAAKQGCYVFAIRNRGLTPIYIGQATKSFKQETFNPQNRHKYHDGFSEYAKGTPLMYFIVHPAQRGRVNAKQIANLEEFLIQAGAAKNPDLQNVRGRHRPKWSIKGVIRSTAGNRSAAETQVRTLFDIRG